MNEGSWVHDEVTGFPVPSGTVSCVDCGIMSGEVLGALWKVQMPVPGEVICQDSSSQYSSASQTLLISVQLSVSAASSAEDCTAGAAEDADFFLPLRFLFFFLEEEAVPADWLDVTDAAGVDQCLNLHLSPYAQWPAL